MTNNPFEAMGGEGFDMNALLAQAQEMQTKLEEAQQQLADSVIGGSAGGVAVKVSGTGDLLGVDIASTAVDAADPEALADLGDLIVAAYRDAKAKADAMAAQALGPLAGGGGLPGMPDPGQLGF